MSFVRKHGLWSAEHIEAANRLRRIPEDKGSRTFQFSLPDQHGLLRGKTQIGGEALSLIEGGCSATTTLLAGYITSYRVSPLRGWRRLWYEADKGRLRPPDGSRPDHVQGAALRRPGGCRAICTSPNRCPVPFARAAYIVDSRTVQSARLSVQGRPRGLMPYLQVGKSAACAGRCRQSGRGARCQPAVAELSTSDRATLRSDGAGA